MALTRAPLLALLALACGPYLPAGAVALAPVPAAYAAWAAEVAACAGLPDRSLDGRVTWWVVDDTTNDGADFVCEDDGSRCSGLWTEDWAGDRKIYLARFHVDDEGTVKHELLHDDTYGAEGHPSPPFKTCAPIYGAPQRRRE